MKQPCPFEGYKYELKIGKSPHRLFGNVDDNGILVFDKFIRKGLHKG